MNKRSFFPHGGRVCLPALLCVGLFTSVCRRSIGAQDAVITASGELNGYHIPFTYDPLLQPMIIVKVSIDGKAPLPFVVDTGSEEALLIDTKAAEKLGIIPDLGTPEEQVGGLHLRPTHIKSAGFAYTVANKPMADQIALIGGNVPASVGDLTVFKSSPGSDQIAGVVGIPILSGSTVQFDFAAHIMTLYAGPHPNITIAGASVLPMSPHYLGGAGSYSIMVTLEKGITTDLFLDTGADSTCIPLTVAAQLHPLAAISIGMITVYGISAMPRLLLPSVQLGSYNLDKIAVNSQPDLKSLGMNVLSRFRVTMDFPNRQLLLERPADYEQRVRLDGYTGIAMIAKGHDFAVESVDEGSPAQRAGIQPGNLITAIDGHTLEGHSLISALNLLSGNANTQAEIRVQPGSGPAYVAKFDRISEFDRPGRPVDGLSLNIPAGRPMELLALISGSIGANAGLMQGDVILELNGYPTQAITVETLAAEFNKPELRLKVQRKDVSAPLSFTLATQQPPK